MGFLLFCSPLLAQEEPGEKIILLTTYNLNSNYDRMARFYTYIKKREKEYPQRVILLDSGRQCSQKNFYTKITRGTLNLKLMNFMGYKGATPSFSGLVLRKKNWQSFLKKSDFPWISSNIQSTQGTYLFPPYWVQKIQGKKLAIFALINPKIFEQPYYKAFFQELSVQDGEKALSKVLPPLSHQSDITILLSNSGALSDVYLATKFDNLHIICGLANHSKKPYLQRINNAYLLWQEKSGRWMGELVLEGIKKSSPGLPFKVSFQAIDSEKLAPHKDFQDFLKKQINLFKKGSWNRELSEWNGKLLDSPKAQQALTLLLCKALQRETRAEVVLIHLPSFEKKFSHKERITPQDLWELLPLPNNAVEALLSGKVLRSLWENSPKNRVFLYGIEEKKEKGATVYSLGDKILKDDQLYRVVSCMEGLEALHTAKAIKVIEGDFFHHFVEDLEKSKITETIEPKGGKNEK